MLWLMIVAAIDWILLMIIALREVRRPSLALVWLVISLVLPVLGPFIYFMLTRPLAHRRTFTVPFQTEPNQGYAHVLADGTHKYGALICALSQAKVSIDMEYYIFRDDVIGKRISSILLEKAKSGVKVRFLRDGLGSRKYPKRALQSLTDSGVDCRVFAPLRFPWLTPELNSRDHCKIVIVDGTMAFTGGMNVGDEYTGRDPNIGPWRDTHLVLTGPCVQGLKAVFDANWSIACKDKRSQTRFPGNGAEPRTIGDRVQPGTPGEQAEPRSTGNRVQPAWDQVRAVQQATGTEAATFDIPTWFPQKLVPVECQTIDNGPDREAQRMRSMFFLCITQAAKRVDITTPYFVPDADLTMALKLAVSRGVRVRLLIPKRPDHPIVGYASRTYHAELIEAGVELYLYQGAVLHAKTMTIDEDMALIGAANWDSRSFRLNYEICEALYSQDIVAALTDQFETDLTHAERATVDLYENRPVWDRIAERGARLLAPLL